MGVGAGKRKRGEENLSSLARSQAAAAGLVGFLVLTLYVAIISIVQFVYEQSVNIIALLILS